MFEFLRSLLEAEMDQSKAKAIFKGYGATDEIINDPTKLKAFWRRTMRDSVHSDIGGSKEGAANFNAAYDALKHGVTSAERPMGSGGPDEPTPIWAMAGHSGGMPPNTSIYKQNYTDMNYFKKSMYMMSKDDNNQQVYNVMAFDGYFFRHSLSTYASPRIFQELAQAMIMWNSHGGNPYSTRAVFIQVGRNPELYLIYADGVYYNNSPIPFEHDSFNMNPGNDQQFVRRLPEMLDKLKETGSV